MSSEGRTTFYRYSFQSVAFLPCLSFSLPMSTQVRILYPHLFAVLHHAAPGDGDAAIIERLHDRLIAQRRLRVLRGDQLGHGILRAGAGAEEHVEGHYFLRRQLHELM